MTTTLKIDDFTFQNFEIPDDIDKFGVTQKNVVHDCPGGVRIVQCQGQFPVSMVTWSGHLMVDSEIGQDPAQRVKALKDLCDDQPHSLSYADFAYLVYVHAVYFKPKQETHYPYTIELIPVLDQALSTSQPGTIPAPSGAQGSASTLSKSSANLTQSAFSNGNSALPSSTQSALSQFQKSLNNALQLSGGNIGQIPTAPLLSSIGALQSSLAPLAAGAASGVSSSAFAASNVLNNIADQLSAPTQPLAVLQTVNPDLKRLALQWYGDASQWQIIAKNNIDPNTSQTLQRTRYTDGPRTIIIPPLPVSNV